MIRLVMSNRHQPPQLVSILYLLNRLFNSAVSIEMTLNDGMIIECGADGGEQCCQY
jgi:hypothetical protein